MSAELTEKDIKKVVRRCMNHLKLKRYELGITKQDVDFAVTMTRAKRTNGASAGATSIYIGLKPWEADKGNFHFNEYSHYNKDKVIGAIDCKTLENMMLLIVAHEVSHHVQSRLAPFIKRYQGKHQRSHGECFRDIYRMLRRGLVNPTIEATP